MGLGESFYEKAVDFYCSRLSSVFSSITDFGTSAEGIVNHSSAGGMNWQFLEDVDNQLDIFVVDNFMPNLCGLAIAIAMIFFLISILQLVTEDRFTPEFLVKFFAKFIIAFCVILWSPDLLRGIIDFGDAFGRDMGNYAATSISMTNGTAADVDNLEAIIKNHGMHYYKKVEWDGYPKFGISRGNEKDTWALVSSAVGMFVSAGLLSIFELVGFVLVAIVMFIIFTNTMELYIRGAFLPVAASLMSDDGWKGSGGRYFRKLMALATRYGVVLVIVNIMTIMINSTITGLIVQAITAETGHAHATGSSIESIAGCPTCLEAFGASINFPVARPFLFSAILCVAGIAMMFKSQSVVDDIWGAR